MKTTLFFLLLVVLTFFSSAQTINFKKVNPPASSFVGWVGNVVQDKQGYVWITSRNALFRYDGYDYKRYVPKSPADFRLELSYIDRQGIIWIATWLNGMYRFDPVTETFTHFLHDPKNPASLADNVVRSFLEDREGTLWVGSSGGLAWLDRNTFQFHHYRHDPVDASSISCNRVKTIIEDAQGTLWVGTGSVWEGGEAGDTDEGGLNRFDKKTGKFIRYLYDPANSKALINNKVKVVFEDSRGVMWVGTAGDGLHTLNRTTGEFERHLYNPAHPEKLSRSKYVEDNNDHITFITEDVTGFIWIGTLRNGLVRYDPIQDISTHIGAGEAGLTTADFWSAFTTNDGILWISDFYGKLYQFDPRHQNIPYVSLGTRVTSFCEDGSGGLWIGTHQGIIVQDQQSGAATKRGAMRQTKYLANEAISALYKDPAGVIWVGTPGGIRRFQANTNSFSYYPFSHPGELIFFGSSGISSIADAGGDSLWIGSVSYGLYLMDKRTGHFTPFQTIEPDSNTVDNHIVASLWPEPSGDLWVGEGYTFGGLKYLERKTGKLTRVINNDAALAIFRDAEGTIWIGANSGLYRKKNSEREFIKVFDAEMNGVMVSSIVEDDQQNLWVYSGKGFLRINPARTQLKFFGPDFGVDNETFPALFVQRGIVGKTGQLYFGDAKGYYIISPDALTSNNTVAQITINDIEINGASYLQGNPQMGSLENLNSLVLRHDQNVLNFYFTGIHFAHPEQNRHYYRLDNYDADWRLAGPDRMAYYSNLKPGTYTFRVKVAGVDDFWNEKTIEITVRPPWWKTWWAYLTYALLLGTGVFLVDRYQRQRFKALERRRILDIKLSHAQEIEKAYDKLKTAQSQLIQSEKMASLGELTAGIAHEIQNPLNFVNNFSEVNKELIGELKEEISKGNLDSIKIISDDLEANEDKIMQHGKRADAIVKSMLQHSRISTGQKEWTDINALCDEYLRLAYHGLCAKDKSFNAKFETNLDPTLPKVNIIPQDLGRVILNLLNNAFYAVNESSKNGEAGYQPIVSVTTKLMANSQLQIAVKDNGPGIPDSIKEKIFQPFFTTKPTGQGTGLGLSLAYDIVKAHGGELKVEGKEGEGSMFLIQIPILP